jgi:cytochrome c-type protein NapB
MSHPRLEMCQQCHAAAPGAAPPPASDFVGLGAAGSGRRAYAGAPPTIPHGAWMREACDSCHGLAGAPGLRTTHPERQSCTQCHAPDASLEARFPVVASRP